MDQGDQEDQEMAEADAEVEDHGAPQPEQMNPSLDPDQPFNLAGKYTANTYSAV